MLPIAVNFSPGVRVEVDEPAPAEADELPDADELDEPSPEEDEASEDADEASEDADEASEDAMAVVEELSPLLSLAVCDAVSQAARKNVTANSAIRR